MIAGARHQLMDAARVRAQLTLDELWVRYAALTGTVDVIDLDGFLAGLMLLEPGQDAVLTQTLNEALEEAHRANLVPLSPFAAVSTSTGT
ncbi:hypothetical protein [uncultured Modestobacter sp.]|uniref:hypothetical protein n=1 Tax=uncultured Modestobacter sp. TaxID=380048 RepID=UPI00261788CD|nr:hypothetical protein [uncultured Modestobacter sp.]